MYLEKSALACVQAKKSLSAVFPTHPCSENATIMSWYSGGKSRLTNSNKCFRLPMGHVMTPAFHKLLSKVTHWTHNVLGDGTQEEDHIQEDH